MTKYDGTYYNIIVTTIALTAFGTSPILIPNMCTVWHILSSNFRTQLFGWTSFGHVILLQCSQCEIRLTAPSNFCETNIFTWFTSFNCIQTFFRICCLISAHIAFKGWACKISNKWINSKISFIFSIFLLTSRK